MENESISLCKRKLKNILAEHDILKKALFREGCGQSMVYSILAGNPHPRGTVLKFIDSLNSEVKTSGSNLVYTVDDLILEEIKDSSLRLIELFKAGYEIEEIISDNLSADAVNIDFIGLSLGWFHGLVLSMIEKLSKKKLVFRLLALHESDAEASPEQFAIAITRMEKALAHRCGGEAEITVKSYKGGIPPVRGMKVRVGDSCYYYASLVGPDPGAEYRIHWKDDYLAFEPKSAPLKHIAEFYDGKFHELWKHGEDHCRFSSDS